MNYFIATCVFIGVFSFIISLRTEEAGPFLAYSILSSGAFFVATALVLDI